MSSTTSEITSSELDHMPTITDNSSTDLVFGVWPASGEDGSCLFESVRMLMSMSHTYYTTQDLRSLCSNFLKYNYKSPDGRINEKPEEEHWELIKEKGYWGSAVDLKALTRYFLIDFRVIIMENKKITSPVQSFAVDIPEIQEFCYLLYNGSHYDPLAMVNADFTRFQTKFYVSQSDEIQSILKVTFIDFINNFPTRM